MWHSSPPKLALLFVVVKEIGAFFFVNTLNYVQRLILFALFHLDLDLLYVQSATDFNKF